MEPNEDTTDDDFDPRGCDCTSEGFIGIQYADDHPYSYDGVSEWMCSKCWRRWGRWSGKELTGDESEKPPI